MRTNAAFLWDESFLWGLMAYKALKTAGLPFEIIRAEDIKNGKLKNHAMLFVPGGWASNKVKTLGDKGISEIKKFVNDGGNYLGFCGGAGLATLDGIGLLNIKRMPTKQRVPSFSGKIYLNINDHSIFQTPSAISHQPSAFISHAWWPSQFLIADENIKTLATYGNALPDSFSSDLNVGDVEANGSWQELENLYQINLDPKRLLNEPAVVEGDYGKGKVILSLVHFDTPDDDNGAVVLKNLWKYLAKGSFKLSVKSCEFKENNSITPSVLSDLETEVDDLISLGMRNFLWFWRNPMLLQWRRGVRGLEYCTLYIMIKEIAEIIKKQRSAVSSQQSDLNKIKKLLMPFTEKAKRLLIMERVAMQNGHITYEKCDDPKIQEMRAELFGNSKSHGGLFKELIDTIDDILYTLIRDKQD
jgi:phosphoribosylformylglycinamidine (FGAM) synthase-like amidotransferase family enzyme